MIIDRHETHCRSDRRRHGNVNYSVLILVSVFFVLLKERALRSGKLTVARRARQTYPEPRPQCLFCSKSAILPARSVLIESARR
jgi:hypothetical protein